MDFFANFKNFLRAILDVLRLGKFRGAIFDGLISPTSKLFIEQFLDAHWLGKLRGAIFDGLLRRLQNFFFERFSTHIGWENFVEPRCTSSPTSKFLFERFSTLIGWENFVEGSSMDFFDDFKILLQIILGTHRLRDFRGVILEYEGGKCFKSYLISLSSD